MLTGFDTILAQASASPQSIALSDELGSFTFESLLVRITDSFAALSSLGFCADENCLVQLPTCKEYLIALYAIQRAGGTASTVNPRFTRDELLYQLSDCQSR